MKVRISPRRSLAATAALAVFLAAATAACSGSTPSAAPGATGATRIEVTLSDNFTIAPNPLIVPAGVPVTFVVTNRGAIDHEIYFGDQAAQDEHDQEMRDEGGMPHDHPDGIGVKPGETKEFTKTFTATAGMLAGCHVPGHYQAGMKATVEIR